MKYLDHLKRFKVKLNLLIRLCDEFKNVIEEEIDFSIFFNEGHWAIYHLISALLDTLEIPEKLKHKNHRGLKNVLSSNEVVAKLNENANLLYELYSSTLGIMSKGEYGKIETIATEDFTLFRDSIKKVKEIIEIYLGRTNELI